MKRLLIVIALSFISAGLVYFPRSVFFSASPRKIPEITSVATSSSDTINTFKGSSFQGEEAVVKRVIDGDTIELADGRRIRYIGIDTPEVVHPKKPVDCFGNEAREANQELVEGKTIRLEKDISKTDKYGRLLRYVYTGNTFVNDYLVRQGFAFASTYPPDVSHQEEFRLAEQEARKGNLGLWKGCVIDRGK